MSILQYVFSIFQILPRFLEFDIFYQMGNNDVHTVTFESRGSIMNIPLTAGSMNCVEIHGPCRQREKVTVIISDEDFMS